MSEFSPPGRWARMSKSQVKKYIKDLEEKRRIAKERLELARANWEFEGDEEDLRRLEELLA